MKRLLLAARSTFAALAIFLAAAPVVSPAERAAAPAHVASTSSSVAPAKQYRRIVSFSPGVTEIIYKLGGQDRLVGISSFSDYPPEAAKEKPQVGAILNVDAEKILSLRPDLIISPPGAMAKEKLTRLGADVEFLPDKTLDDLAKSFVRIGELVGRPAEGRALSAELASAVAAAKKRNASRPPVKTLIVIGYEPMWVAGGYGVVDELLLAGGGQNVAGAVRKDFYAVSFESVLASEPDVIVDLTLPDDAEQAARDAIVAFWKRFPTIPAVKNSRIEFVDIDLLTIPGPRLVDGLARLEKALRPQESLAPRPRPADAPSPASGGSGSEPSGARQMTNDASRGGGSK